MITITSTWNTYFKGCFTLFCMTDWTIRHKSWQESSLTMGNYSHRSMIQSVHGLNSSLMCSFPLLTLCCKHNAFSFVAAQLFMSLCCEPDLWNLAEKGSICERKKNNIEVVFWSFTVVLQDVVGNNEQWKEQRSCRWDCLKPTVSLPKAKL